MSDKQYGSWGRVIVLFLVCCLFSLMSAGAGTRQETDSAQKQQQNKSMGQPKQKRAPATADDTSQHLSEQAYNADASQYVGTDTCKTCHEDIGKTFDQGPHWKTLSDKRRGPQWQGCEACHGPGKAHAESADPSKIIRFAGLSREESSKRCLLP